jgi:DNA-binding HxlR family transcriptional regulator
MVVFCNYPAVQGQWFHLATICGFFLGGVGLMSRKRLENDICPIARSLAAVGDAWSLLVVRDAVAGKRRFGEFERNLGIAKNILAARLRKLVGAGVLRQVPTSDGSGYSDYELTDRGRGLVLVLAALGQWGGAKPEFQFVDVKKGKAVRLELRGEDGRKVALNDVRLVTSSDRKGIAGRPLPPG